jgi:copper chaperone
MVALHRGVSLGYRCNIFKENTMDQSFTVTGMTCGHCEMAVKRAITQLDPQAQVTIDRQANKVEVTSQQSRDALAKAITEEGYAVVA